MRVLAQKSYSSDTFTAFSVTFLKSEYLGIFRRH